MRRKDTRLKRILVATPTLAILALALAAASATAGNRQGSAGEVTYRVAGDTLTNNRVRAADARLWQRFVQIIPPEQRSDLRRFTVFRSRFTDGFVGPLPRRTDLWQLGLRRALVNEPELDEVIVHEFGHLLTLTSDQVPPHTRPRSRRPKCTTFNTGEGCALPESYIALYVQEFWRNTGTLKAWKRVDRIQNQRRYDIAVRRFFRQHRGQFVTRYASTNPGEDIAESWTSFVLDDLPTRGVIAAEKHRFFERFPELVELRARILENLANAPA
ncbi:MAG: hypothetical protein ACR2OD_00465 [Gaiellaceae bacterium]